MDKTTEELLNSILERQDIKVHFQPVVHIKTRQIYGYEGLIRGPVNTVFYSPTRLFEAAIWAGRLAELDLLCRQMVISRFAKMELPGMLFLNVDPYSMLHEHFRGGLTLDYIEQEGMKPNQVIIELTETHLVEDAHMMQEALVHYRQMGFRVALDDLGAGYSGLQLWSEIRPDIVKVDRHFIQGIDENGTKQQFVSDLLYTAGQLECRVITEGVETEKEYATLRELGVEMVQGYYFSRPVEIPPLAVASKLFRKEKRTSNEEDSPTVGILLRPAISVQADTKVMQVGELFSSMPDEKSIVVLHDGEVIGMVLRWDFMNIYAGLCGKEVFGKQAIFHFMNSNIMQVEQHLSLEDASYRLTTAPDVYTDEFVILDGCRLAGKARILDLLNEITKLHVYRSRYANPLTLLPGNVPMQRQLQKVFRQSAPFVVCYFDLDDFKSFNDLFGFSRGDKVINLISELLAANSDDRDDFIAHLGGDDFVVIFKSDDWQASALRILKQFDDRIGDFCHDHIDNVITIVDREGKERKNGRMTLSVGAVVVRPSDVKCRIELSEAASIAKQQAKVMEGSSLFIYELKAVARRPDTSARFLKLEANNFMLSNQYGT